MFLLALLVDVMHQALRTKEGLRGVKRPRTLWIDGVVACLVLVLLVLVAMSPSSMLFQLLAFTAIRCYSWFVLKTSIGEEEQPKNAAQEFWTKLLRYPRALIVVFSAAILVPTLFISTMSMVFIPLNKVGVQMALPVFALLLTVSLHRYLKVNLTIARVILLMVVLFYSSFHLIVYKALLPTNHKEHYGLTARSSNYAAIGGWDWGISWLRFSATPEELETVLDNMNWTIRIDGNYQTFPMIKDSALVLPPYRRGFSGGFDPFTKITVPCEHWHVDEETHLPINLYYDRENQVIEIFKTDEMDMDPRARY